MGALCLLLVRQRGQRRCLMLIPLFSDTAPSSCFWLFIFSIFLKASFIYAFQFFFPLCDPVGELDERTSASLWEVRPDNMKTPPPTTARVGGEQVEAAAAPRSFAGIRKTF